MLYEKILKLIKNILVFESFNQIIILLLFYYYVGYFKEVNTRAQF